MAIGSGTAVNVPIKLEVLRSSIGELEKVLGSLKPDSKSFKDLQKIITDTRREMDRLQAQTSRPFGSQQQFNQAEKSVDKIDEALEQARLTISRIKFDELELSPEQLQQFQEFDDRIKQLAQNLIDFKNQMKAGLLEDVDFSNFLRSIDPQYAEKSFDEIIQMVETKTKEIADKLQKSERALSTYQRTAELGTRITQAQNKARNNKDLMKQANAIFGANKAEEFFTVNKNGVFGAKSGKRDAFFEELKTQFSLTPQQLDELKNLTAREIFEKIFTTDENNPKNNFFAPQLKKAAEASNKMITEQSNRDELVQQSNRLQAANDKVRDSTNQVAEAERKTTEAINNETAAKEQNKQSTERAAQGQDNYGDSLSTSRTQLDSFRQTLEQTNVAFLRNERQAATFNSIKSAITNFMGFNQVLNLTRRAISEAANHIKQLDTVMNGIAIVTDMTTADLWQQVDTYSRIAQNYGTSIQGAYEVSKIYYQAGYETADVMTLTNETLKLSTISGLDYATTTDYMMTA